MDRTWIRLTILTLQLRTSISIRIGTEGSIRIRIMTLIGRENFRVCFKNLTSQRSMNRNADLRFKENTTNWMEVILSLWMYGIWNWIMMKYRLMISLLPQSWILSLFLARISKRQRRSCLLLRNAKVFSKTLLLRSANSSKIECYCKNKGYITIYD